jgi:DNA repair photolyase
MISMFGNISDVYQPAESKFEITRKLLNIAYDYGFPIRLLTKSKLVLRDIDILKNIHRENFARVSFTITLADEKTQKIFEPNASTSQERFDALKHIREEGISAGVYVTPVIPFIGDTEENLRRIFQSAKDANAEFILTGGLTLRPGRIKNAFLHTIDKNFNELLPKYQRLYGQNHRGGQPDPNIAAEYNLIDIIKTGYQLSKEYGITFYEPRYIPSGQKMKNLQISTALSRIAFLKEKVFHEQNDIREIRLAADYIEKTERDIEYMSDEELAKMPLNSHIIKIIKEIVLSNSCRYLESLNEWDNLLYSK